MLQNSSEVQVNSTQGCVVKPNQTAQEQHYGYNIVRNNLMSRATVGHLIMDMGAEFRT